MRCIGLGIRRQGRCSGAVHVGREGHVRRPDAALSRDAMLLALTTVRVLAIALDLALLARKARVDLAALSRRWFSLGLRRRDAITRCTREYIRRKGFYSMVVLRSGMIAHAKRLLGRHRQRVRGQRLGAGAIHGRRVTRCGDLYGRSSEGTRKAPLTQQGEDHDTSKACQSGGRSADQHTREEHDASR